MGLSSLDAALSGLRVSQRQISVISNNVANVNTAGFTRKTISQQSQAIAGETVGAINGTIVRNVDLNLSRDLWTQVSAVGELDVRQSYLERIEKFHGPPDAELSVAAEISRLKDSFASLADSPSDNFLLASTVRDAQDTANKINELSTLITTLRNDAQNEIQSSVTRINQLLEKVAELNTEIRNNLNIGRSVAQAEDQRDEAIKELSGLMDIDFFKRGDGVLVVQMADSGAQLADTRSEVLNFFNSSQLSAQSYYPDSAAGVFIVDQQFTGDPTTSLTAIDITELEVGGKLGGLLTLRDQDFPRQMAQLDELAHKMALRFEQQGLRLFTDATGSVPLDDAPVPGTPPTPVTYVGFSAVIQVNAAVLADHSLLQQGTVPTDNTLQGGSNEVLRRVVEFVFGDVEFQEAGNLNADGTFNTAEAVDLLNLPAGTTDLQTLLGLSSTNTVVGSRDLSGFASPAAFLASTNGTIDPLGVPPTDTMRFTFDSATTGAVNIDVDIGAIADGAGNFVQDLITHITGTVIPALPVAQQTDLTAMNVSFSETTSGQLAINGSGTIAVDITNPADTMAQAGLNFLGFVDNSTSPAQPTHPYFDIKVGNNNFTRITIEPGDTYVELLDKLTLNPAGDSIGATVINAVGDTTGVPGLAVDFDQFDPGGANTGYLRLRPGDDFNNPNFGGDITIVGGPFVTDATATYTDVGPNRTAMDAGVNVISALFGSYSISGGAVNNASPITDNPHSSLTGVGTNTAGFRSALLGPGATISTQVEGSVRLVDFGQKMINQQAQEIIDIQNLQTDEESLRDILQTDLLNESGVNLDEELANLIVYQTAFSASARVVNAVDELFQELLNAF